MVQAWSDIAGSDRVTDSRAVILARDEAVKSNFGGTSFPSDSLVAGMFCFRTDQLKLYQLKDLTPTWKLVVDLAKTYITVEDANALYKAIGYVPAASGVTFANSGTGLTSSDAQAAIVEVKTLAASKLGSWANVAAVIPTTSNAYGTHTVSSSAPSGGADGDTWDQTA